ncbi:MAG: hypothetical protein WAO28_01130 [Candidatus Microsaccharimonas sp.]
MKTTPLLQSPVTDVAAATEEASAASNREGLQQDLIALMVSPESARSTPSSAVDPISALRMSTPVDFDSAFKRYHGKPMATHA